MRIDRYETVRLLGKGGMSEVYEVEDPRLGSRHALKLFTYEKDDPDVRERFLVEGKLLARLNHPRIVRVTDFGTDEATGKPYFVMDLVLNGRGEMQQLSDVEPGTVDEETVGRWYDDLREGLAYIHANGVIHRDLKLQNVLIGPDGHAVLTDFGISKIFDAKGDGVQIVDTVKTLVKVCEGRSLVMGSIGYMAPELEMGVAASPQSDWYALGVIIYRLLTGTWCDARTDIQTNLETYDPAWKRIIPKLLHSNPAARECLSYEQELKAEREHTLFETEERVFREKARGHLARHIARTVSVLLILALALLGVLASRCYEKPLTFNELFVVPAEVGEVETAALPSKSQFQLARIDAWVLTEGLFRDLAAGTITKDKVKSEILAISDSVEKNDISLFSRFPQGFVSSSENKALQILLKSAIKNIGD